MLHATSAWLAPCVAKRLSPGRVLTGAALCHVLLRVHNAPTSNTQRYCKTVDGLTTMHILLLDLGREMRGGQRQVLYLARALQRDAGFTPLVACPAGAPLLAAAQAEGIATLPLPGRRVWNPLVLFTALRAMKLHGTAVIHTHDARSAALGDVLCRMGGSHLRLVHSRRVSYPLGGSLRRGKYARAHAIACVSAEIADTVAAAGIPREKLHVIHSGIDPTLYAPKRPRTDGRIVFGMVGALTPQKGHSVLLAAMAALQGALGAGLPPWEVRVAGSGPLFDAILAEAKTLGVAERLALLGWQDSKVILPHCDVLVVPSVDGEGSSGTIKEGWVVGLPVVASDLASNLELVRDGVNGLVFPSGNGMELAACMARVVRDQVLHDRIVAGGTASVATVTDARMAHAYKQLYVAVVEE